MNRLEDLVPSLTDMTHEEGMEKIREIREDRKINKHAVTARKKKEKDNTKRIEKQIDTLTDEERAQMIKLLTDS